MKLTGAPSGPVALPRVRIPLAGSHVVIRAPGPGLLTVYNKPIRDMNVRGADVAARRAAAAADPLTPLEALRSLRHEMEQHAAWGAYATAWLVLRMVEDPAWEIETLAALDRGDLDRGPYPELQYGEAFMTELHEATGYDAGAVWAFLNAASSCVTSAGLTEAQAREVATLAEHFPAAGGVDGPDDR